MIRKIGSPCLKPGFSAEEVDSEPAATLLQMGRQYGITRVLTTLAAILVYESDDEAASGHERIMLRDVANVLVEVREGIITQFGPCRYCHDKGWLVESVGTDFRIVACSECRQFKSTEDAREAVRKLLESA